MKTLNRENLVGYNMIRERQKYVVDRNDPVEICGILNSTYIRFSTSTNLQQALINYYIELDKFESTF